MMEHMVKKTWHEEAMNRGKNYKFKERIGKRKIVIV